jgi:hypothetical protein
MLAPNAIASNISAMKQFDGLVLVGTPATAFTLDQLQTIAGFAHDLGRGLLVIGGPQSYGQGKYGRLAWLVKDVLFSAMTTVCRPVRFRGWRG